MRSSPLAKACSRLRTCAAVSAWSNTTISASWASAASRISSTLPEPAKVAGSARARLPRITCDTRAPALSIRRAASSQRPSARGGGDPISRLTRTARGRSGFVRVLNRYRNRPRRDNGRDGVLVHHLRHGVLEEHDVLVERFDLALQLDAVHQVDRDRNMLFAQRVEERVL